MLPSHAPSVTPAVPQTAAITASVIRYLIGSFMVVRKHQPFTFVFQPPYLAPHS